MCSRSLFFTAADFDLALVAASNSHFVTAATKFSCCSSNKKKSFRAEVERILNSRVTGMLTWDQALFSCRFLKLMYDRRANSKFDQTF